MLVGTHNTKPVRAYTQIIVLIKLHVRGCFLAAVAKITLLLMVMDNVFNGHGPFIFFRMTLGFAFGFTPITPGFTFRFA